MQTIQTSVEAHVGELVLSGPKRGNPLSPTFFDELPNAVAELNDNPDVRVILLRAAGADFSFGLDLVAAMTDLGPLMADPDASGRGRLRALILRWQASVSSLAHCQKPVIAAVQGRCIGGGLDLIAACDIRLASADAVISLRETRIAMVADLGSLQRLPPIIGQGATRELAYTGKDIDAAHAQQIGLVNHVYDDADRLLDGARAMAAQIAKNSPLAVQGCKAVLDYGADKSVAEGLDYVAVWNSAFLVSEDLGAAISAFASKKEAVFQGK